MSVSPENKALAHYLRSVLGGSPRVFEYLDQDERTSIDVMIVKDAPIQGVTTCATLGLSGFPSGIEVDGTPLGVELLIAAASSYEFLPNVLSTCAFNIIKDKMRCYPGQVFPSVIEMYHAGRTMRHILFVAPFLWQLKTQEFPQKKVTWLMAIPISETEYVLAEEEGSSTLEDLFEEKQVDVFNLERESVL